MSEIPLEGPEISLDQVEALGALEKAFEEALSQVPHSYVLSQVMAMFPKVMHPKVIVELDRDELGRFHGRVQKVSVSMPEDLATAIREHTGPGGFSRFVAEAAERQLQERRIPRAAGRTRSRERPHSTRTRRAGDSGMAVVLRGGVAGTLVLDAQGIVRLAEADKSVFAWARRTDALGGDIVTAASTLAEVLRGGARDARIHRILRRVTVVEIDKSVGRKAGELLGATGMSGQRCTVDALLAAVALAQRRPVILLTSDPDDLARLTEEPDRRKRERVAVIKL